MHRRSSDPLRLLAAWLWRQRYYSPLLLAAGLAFWFRFALTSWTLEQLALLIYGLIVSPITPEQQADINFWGGQLFGSGVIIIVTWIVLTQRHWQTWVLENVFVLPLQKAVFRHFFMQSLEDAVFLFTMRQVVVLTSWMVVPPAVRTDMTAFDGWVATLRFLVDARLATLTYIVTSLVWYGANVGLYQRPVEPAGYRMVTAALRGAVYVGVAIVRLYPALNSRGVTLLEFFVVLLSRYPLVAVALGALAVEPAERIGGWIRRTMGVSLPSIALINGVNVACMLWSSAAGKYMGELILQDVAPATAEAAWKLSANGTNGTMAAVEAAAAAAGVAASSSQHADLAAAATAGFGLSISPLVEILFRALLLLLCGLVLASYGHALYLLYYASPLLLCDFDVPRVTGVEFLEGGEIVEKVWGLYTKHMEASVAASLKAFRGAVSAGLSSLVRSVSTGGSNGASGLSGAAGSVGAGTGGMPSQSPTLSPASSSSSSSSPAVRDGSNSGSGASVPPARSASASGDASASAAGAGAAAAGGDDSVERVLTLLMDALDVAISLHNLALGERFAIRMTASLRARNVTGRTLLLQPCAIDVLAAAAAPDASAASFSRSAGSGSGADAAVAAAAQLVPYVPPTLALMTLQIHGVEIPSAADAFNEDDADAHAHGNVNGNAHGSAAHAVAGRGSAAAGGAAGPAGVWSAAGASGGSAVPSGAGGGDAGKRRQRSGSLEGDDYYTCEVDLTVTVYLHLHNIVELVRDSWAAAGGRGGAGAGNATVELRGHLGSAGGGGHGSGRSDSQQRTVFGLSTLLATLYMASPLSQQFVFSVPLLTWLQGRWRGIGLLDPIRYERHLDVRGMLANRGKLRAFAEGLSARRASAAAEELSSLPPDIREEAGKLLFILTRINSRGNAAAVAAANSLHDAAAAAAAAAVAQGSGSGSSSIAGSGVLPRGASAAATAAAAASGEGEGDLWPPVSLDGSVYDSGTASSSLRRRGATAAAADAGASGLAVPLQRATQLPPLATPAMQAEEARRADFVDPTAASLAGGSPRKAGAAAAAAASRTRQQSLWRRGVRSFSETWNSLVGVGGNGSGSRSGEQAAPRLALSGREAGAAALRNRSLAAGAATASSTASVVRSVLATELPDLLRALYLIISLRRRLARAGLLHQSRAFSLLLLEAASALVHLFYDTVFVEFAGGRDPLHLLVLSGGVLGLQAILQAVGISHEAIPPAAPPAPAAVAAQASLPATTSAANGGPAAGISRQANLQPNSVHAAASATTPSAEGAVAVAVSAATHVSPHEPRVTSSTLSSRSSAGLAIAAHRLGAADVDVRDHDVAWSAHLDPLPGIVGLPHRSNGSSNSRSLDCEEEPAVAAVASSGSEPVTAVASAGAVTAPVYAVTNHEHLTSEPTEPIDARDFGHDDAGIASSQHAAGDSDSPVEPAVSSRDLLRF